MNRQQAINYLLSSGFSEEQINTIEQAFKQEQTNDLVVDCISRQAVIDLMMQKWGENFSGDDAMQESIDAIRVMPSVTPQEPKPMVEIDLYSVIKQKYIEREVLDKIRAEIEQLPTNYIEIQRPHSTVERDVVELGAVMRIIDKCNAETENT